MVETNISVTRLQDHDSQRLYFGEVEADARGAAFDVTLTDGSQCWQVQGAQDQSSQHQDWTSCVLDYLQRPGSCAQVSVATAPSGLKVTFFKQREGSSMRLKYSLQLSSMSDAKHTQAILDLLDLLHNSNTRLQERCRKNEADLDKLQGSLDGLSDLRKELEASQQKQKDDYVKFAAILNAKKRRIAELEEQAAQAGGGSAAAKASSDDDSDSEADTDKESAGAQEESDHEEQQPSREHQSSPAQSQRQADQPNIMDAETQLISPPGSPSASQGRGEQANGLKAAFSPFTVIVQ
ncbi:hypothetical protein WJX73_000026 [Symbiochloris irregularis]|uniref:Uncharacterized protein n=1 Tax=Symbiochloris irregularis TaxID=706552 RepID=A0AAW1NM46_9CHLO